MRALTAPLLLFTLAACEVSGVVPPAELDDAVRQRIVQQLSAEYVRLGLKGVDGLPSADQVRALTDASKVDLGPIEIRARRGGFFSKLSKHRGFVMRAQPTVAGHPPPDGRTERFYRLRYRAPSGWRYVKEVSEREWSRTGPL